ncbi:MAG TPA: LysR substrate-binding domain-containing protein, partial [Ramlibacter sp.]|nr:LysR substrate-binding domain-containing protein [Ramlibacter sp.]
MKIALTLQQLEAFAEVARTGNFRAAAQALHVSQPALSRTIRLAEDAVNTRLFDRDTRRVEITPAGRELLPIAQRILADFRSGFGELAQFLEGRSGHVTIAALPSAGVALLPPTIAAFRRDHPQVEFSFLEGPAESVRAAVHEGRADFGITVRPGRQEASRYRHWIDDPFLLLCRADNPLAARRFVPWTVFTQQPFIASGDSSSIRPITDAAFLNKGLQVHPALVFPSVPAAGALVLAGLGITALPRLAFHLLNQQGLAAVPLHGPAVARPIGLVTR